MPGTELGAGVLHEWDIFFPCPLGTYSLVGGDRQEQNKEKINE